MTVELLKDTGVPLEPTAENVLLLGAGFDWLEENTTLQFNKENPEEVKALPDMVKLFLCRYAELMGNSGLITSESIGGLSQSFSSTQRSALLWDAAQTLLGPWLKSQVSSVPSVSRWL